ncbi:MAG TPA: GNAT family N-acetyltransferase [Armatimonadota bacterium]|nr:GNAT family N-acetyltransferase [Armatimonadota bacterium]
MKAPACPGAIEHFAVSLHVAIRVCREEDLPVMEWFGLFTPHREIIQSTFESQERGDMVMLVAESNGYPIAQVWINLADKRSEGIGILWAIRVFPWLQNLGIGKHLLLAGETVLRERGYSCVELGVEEDNPDARRFYERYGYQVVGRETGEYSYQTPDGTLRTVPTDQWIMRKPL